MPDDFADKPQNDGQIPTNPSAQWMLMHAPKVANRAIWSGRMTIAEVIDQFAVSDLVCSDLKQAS